MHGAQNTCLNACILSAKNAHAPVHAHLCNGSETSLPWKLLRTYLEYCELILSLARASYRLSFATRPAAVSTKSVDRRCLIKKSVQIHASSWRGHRCGHMMPCKLDSTNYLHSFEKWPTQMWTSRIHLFRQTRCFSSRYQQRVYTRHGSDLEITLAMLVQLWMSTVEVASMNKASHGRDLFW